MPWARAVDTARGVARTGAARIRSVFRKETLGKDAIAGTVLGIESVPDGLASGLLAGLNPLYGLYAYLFGMAGAALFTSSSLMAVQATGAMSLVVADTDLASRPDPNAALFTLSMLTGVFMIAAGLAGAGRMLRFVPTAVMTGFITAVGVNIVLGQFGNFSGAEGVGENRVTKAVSLLFHLRVFDIPSIVVGAVTIALIIVLGRTRLRSFGLIIAIVAGSLLAAGLKALGLHVAVLNDIALVPGSLPTPVLPSLGDVVFLIVPALSLAFVGIVQGAAVSAGVPNPDGRSSDASRDFIGQGAGNVAAGIFQGMPVGGSMSASALISSAGARTRLSLFISAAVMALLILVGSKVIAFVAMPALAALLIYVGFTSIKPGQVASVAKSGPVQVSVMSVTFVLTLLIPLQFAVLAGVGLGMVLFVAQQSNRVRLRRLVFSEDGRRRETDPPETVGAHEVITLQPYGSLFFASAPVLARQLPKITSQTEYSVVILRLRGIDQIGLSHVDVLGHFAHDLQDRDSRLTVVVSSDRVEQQLGVGGLIAQIGDDAVYRGGEWLGEATAQAIADGHEWVERHRE